MQEFDLHYRVDLPEYDPGRAVMRLTLDRKGGFSEASSAFVEMRTGENPLNVIVSIPVVVKIEKTKLEIRLTFDPRVGASGWYLRIPKTETPKQIPVMDFLIPLKPHLPVTPDKDPQEP